jgi:G3E family GTPase
VVGAIGGQVDPALLYDISDAAGAGDQLSFRELLIADAEPHAHDHDHVHAASVTATSAGCIDPGPLLDLLEQPPTGVYRLKGTVAVRDGTRTRRYVVNVVGPSVHIATAPKSARSNGLVAIGTSFDVDVVRARLDDALRPCESPSSATGLGRLRRIVG